VVFLQGECWGVLEELFVFEGHCFEVYSMLRARIVLC
jgi:hypothetical protein